MYEQQHVHEFSGETTFEFGHSHRYSGYTGPAIETEFDHNHRILIIISIDVDHDHEIILDTGPGFYTERGHFHRFRGETSRNGWQPHTHHFDGATSPLIPYFFSK